MRRRLSVWAVVVVAALVVVAAPASAASTSANTTASDFAAGTLDNMVVSGGGGSAVVDLRGVVDEFEDGSATTTTTAGYGTWSGDTGSFAESAGAGNLTAPTGGTFKAVTLDRPSVTEKDIRTTVRVSDSGSGFDRSVVEMYNSSAGGTTAQVTFTDNGSGTPTVRLIPGSTAPSPGVDITSWSPGTSYTVALSFDFEADTVTATVNGTSATASLDSDVRGWDRVRLSTQQLSSGAGRSLLVDDIYAGEQGETGAYVSDPHTLSGPATGAVNLTRVRNASVSLVWQADSGSGFENVTRQAVTSPGTHTAELDPAADRFRVQVIAEKTAAISRVTLAEDRVTQVGNLTVVDADDTDSTVNSTGSISTNATIYTTDGDFIRETTISDGNVSLVGLAGDADYIIDLQADGYRDSTTVVRDVFDPDRAFLDNRSTVSGTQTANVTWVLSDPTGEFPPEDTTLFVERPIDVGGDTEFRTVAADEFGSTSRYTTELRIGQRYRLRVVSGDSERGLGFYEVEGDATEPLSVKRIEPRAEDGETATVYGGYNPDTGELAVRFRGGTPETTVEYNVTNASGAVVVSNTTVTGSSFAHVYQLPANESYTVAWTATDGEGGVTSGTFAAGSVSGVGNRLGMDTQALSIISWLVILSAMGLVVIVDASLAPAVGTGVASALVIIGTVAIPAPLLGVAGGVSVLSLFGGQG